MKTLLRHLVFFLTISIAGMLELSGQASVLCRSQPFVLNFTKTQYGGANQNWSVCQDQNGVLFFGNTYGLLEYNGAEWYQHTHPNIQIVRSTFADDNGRVYTGSYEEFGYWQRDSFGELYYTSISQELSAEEISNASIWRIFRCKEYIFLHSFGKIFISDGEKVVRSINTDRTFLPMFKYRERPHVFVLDSGLFYINEDLELTLVPGPDFIDDLRIQNMFPINSDTTIVFTEHSGIYFKNGESYFPAKGPDNEYLKKSHINKVIQINENLFAIGTIVHGVITTDKYGNIQSQLDRSNGLQNNAVLGLHKDQNNNLWIALQEGIDFTEVSSPFRFVEDKTGQIGSVRCSKVYRGKLYLGTNHGLFYADWETLISEEETEFRAVPGLDGHVLSLEVLDEQLICSYNLGTYIVEGGRATRLSRIGGQSILVNPSYPRLGYQGLYSGIGLFKKSASGQWAFEKVLLESSDTKYLEMDHEGNLWSSSAFKGLMQHQLNKAGDSILHSNYFGKEEGFISDNNINVFKLENRLVFSNENTFFTYDYLNRHIVPYTWLNEQTASFQNSHIIYKEGNSNYWFLNRSSMGRFHYTPDSLELKYKVTYDYLHSSAVEFVENISISEDGQFVIGLVDGFAILNYKQISEKYLDHPLHNIQINSFLSISDEGDIEPVEISPGTNPQIPIRNRNMYVKFSVPSANRGLFSYRYRISDQEPWTDLGTTNELRYNNLRWGSYNLEITALEETSERSTALSFPFSIMPAWYFHWIAIACYLLFLLIGLFVARQIVKNRLKHHQQEIREKLKRESARKMADLKQEYLQRELRNKSKELLNYTIMLEKRNELLERLKAILEKEVNDPGTPPTRLQLKLIDIIEKNISSQDDWQIFKVHFDAANSDFLKKLKSQHNELTPSDLRFCGFLKMNLTSKEISSLLNISLRSIEVKRYRLRKKLNLEHDQNLIEYLMGI
ncbi:MAG: LuxR C-terminal-related transcriptional regulator [Bacteroides sp.]|nr:LuxR C-terminal-related transcriptional regulator [Bacteroides sp.]